MLVVNWDYIVCVEGEWDVIIYAVYQIFTNDFLINLKKLTLNVMKIFSFSSKINNIIYILLFRIFQEQIRLQQPQDQVLLVPRTIAVTNGTARFDMV